MAALADSELVAALLDRGRPDRPAIVVAHDMLERLGGLEGLSRAGLASLERTDGVGRRSAVRIAASVELGRRLAMRAARPRGSLASPAAVAAFLTPRIGALDVEQMWVLSLDGRNGLLGLRCVAQGGQHGCTVTARDILRTALLDAASGIVLAHNHPSGEPAPSDDDVVMTRAVARAADVVGTPLLDHVIVTASGAYASLLDEGLL